MSDHFHLDVHPAQVRDARRRIGRVLEMLDEVTPRVLTTAREVEGQWTGGPAERVTSEMKALGKQLDGADKPLKDAHRALRNLADAYRDALDELPSLNRRWREAVSAYNAAVSAANNSHTSKLGDIASSDKDEADAKDARDKADRRRDSALSTATSDLTGTQAALEKEFDKLKEQVERDTRSAASTLRRAMLVTPSWLEELVAAGGYDNKFRRRHWTALARRRLAGELTLAAEHHAAVAELSAMKTELERYGLEVPESIDAARGCELVDELKARLDGAEGLDAAARSKLINEWATSLDPVDLSMLVLTDPALVGAVDGIPNAARYAANQANLSNAIEAERAQLERYWNPPPDKDHPQWAEYSRLVDRIKTLKGLQDHPKGREPFQVLHFEPPTYDGNKVVDDGKLAVVRGNLDTAEFVGTVVPGITNRIDNFGATLDKATALQGGKQNRATVAWLGYDTPEFSDASLTEKSEVGGLALKNFTEGLVRNPESDMTILAHSYGTLVTSKALQLGMRPDRVVLFGSPGLGENITHKDDLGLPPDVPVYAMRAYGDPVSITAGHGMDPVDMPGIIRLDTDWSGPEDVTGHSQYTKAGSDALENLIGVLTGKTVRPPGVHGPGYLVTGGNDLDEDGFAGPYNSNLRALVDELQAEVPPDVLEKFVLELEPTIQNMAAGGDTPGLADVRRMTNLVRGAMEKSGIDDHLTAQELQDALIDAGFADRTGDLAGDWVRRNVEGWDGLDGLKVNIRGIQLEVVPPHANEALAVVLGAGTEGAVRKGTELGIDRLPGMSSVLDLTDRLSDVAVTGKFVYETARATPGLVVDGAKIVYSESARRVIEGANRLDDAREAVTDGIADGAKGVWNSKYNILR